MYIITNSVMRHVSGKFNSSELFAVMKERKYSTCYC